MTGTKSPRFNRHSNLSILTAIVLAMLYPRTCCCKADEKPAGYFFAHMMKSDYGRLYYSVSTDSLHWTLLNDSKRVSKDYRGHPDICRGHDGRFYIQAVPARSLYGCPVRLLHGRETARTLV